MAPAGIPSRGGGELLPERVTQPPVQKPHVAFGPPWSTPPDPPHPVRRIPVPASREIRLFLVRNKKPLRGVGRCTL